MVVDPPVAKILGRNCVKFLDQDCHRMHSVLTFLTRHQCHISLSLPIESSRPVHHQTGRNRTRAACQPAMSKTADSLCPINTSAAAASAMLVTMRGPSSKSTEAYTYRTTLAQLPWPPSVILLPF